MKIIPICLIRDHKFTNIAVVFQDLMDVSVQIAWTRFFPKYVYITIVDHEKGVYSGSGFYFLQDPILILKITELGLYSGHK